MIKIAGDFRKVHFDTFITQELCENMFLRRDVEPEYLEYLRNKLEIEYRLKRFIDKPMDRQTDRAVMRQVIEEIGQK